MSMQIRSDNIPPIPFRYKDYEQYWQGLDSGTPVLQKCSDCNAWCQPPQPVCPECLSLNKSWEPITGKGTVYSWVIYHESSDPAFPAPYAVVLVELEEGIRIVGNLVDVTSDKIEVGMSVEVFVEELSDEFKRLSFRKG